MLRNIQNPQRFLPGNERHPQVGDEIIFFQKRELLRVRRVLAVIADAYGVELLQNATRSPKRVPIS